MKRRWERSRSAGSLGRGAGAGDVVRQEGVRKEEVE